MTTTGPVTTAPVTTGPDSAFWVALDILVAGRVVVIERAAGSAHPRFPDSFYPLGYGYLEGTSGGDGAEIDVFVGQAGSTEVTGAVCTVDLKKRDAEVKVLLGCGPEHAEAIRTFLSWPGSFACHVLLRAAPQAPQGRQGAPTHA